MEVSPPSLGIDLGTTFTVGCICDPPNNSGAQPLTIINFRNDVDQIRPQFLPSKVYFTAEKNYFGSSAEQEWKNSKNNKNYIYSASFPIVRTTTSRVRFVDAKRIIGQRMGEQRLENDRKCWPFQLREDPNAKAHRRSPYIYMENLPHDKYVSPEVVSTELIKEVVRRANESLNLKHSLINSAVITCPAYFSGAQRRATMRAAEAAKINVLAIIDEPTAAAIAYAESECHAQDQCILVYDIGGGTFDVSIMEMKDKEISVLAISGDNHLGGEDVVQEMMDYCLDQWRGGWQPFIDKFEALRADDETRKEIEEELVNECRRVIAMLRGWNCYSARVHLKKRKGWPTAPWINVKYNDVDLNSQNNVQEMKKHCLKEWKTQKNYGIVAYMTKYEAAASDVRDQIDQEFLQTCLHALEKLKNKSSQSATLQLKTVGGWPNPPTYKLFSSLLRGLSKHGNVLLEDHDVAENLKTHCFKAWNKLSQEGRYINCFDELDSEDLNADEHPMRCEIKRELRDQCEEAKKMLKDAGSVTIRLLQRFGLPALEFAMTRSKLEEICLTNSADLRKTMGCLQSALSKANKQASDIDKVLLIGGSAELPHISSFLRGKCDGYFPDTGENSASEMMKIVFPEKAFVDISCDKKQYVATGAAIHARRVQEHKTKDESTWTLPRSIGIGYEGGLVEKVLMRGTLLPCVNTTIVFNSSPQQKELVIEIFEGEDVNGNAEANRLITGSSYKTVNKLKTSVVYDIPTRAEGRGDQAFDVKLEVSIDFDLKVSIRPIDHIDTWAPIKLLSDEKNTENTDGLTVKWIDYDYESIHIDRTINEEKGEIDIGFLLFWRDLRQAEILLRRWRQAAEKLGDQRILAEIRQVQEFIDDNELLSREEINEQVDRLFVKVKSSDLPI